MSVDSQKRKKRSNKKKNRKKGGQRSFVLEVLLTILVALFTLCVMAFALFNIFSEKVCEHDFSDRVLKSEATCTNPATYVLSCSKCGEKGEEITVGSALGHEFKVTTKQVSPASCTAAATVQTVCERCGNTGTPVSTGKPSAHSWKNEVSDRALCTPASNTAAALYFKTCMNCGALSETETFSSGSHIHLFNKKRVEEKFCVSTDDHACVVGSELYYSCAYCEEFDQSLSPTFVVTASDVAAHNCVLTDDLDNPLPAHQVTARSCSDGGTYYKYCLCGYFDSSSPTYAANPLPHNYEQNVAFADNDHLKSGATCTTQAVYWMTCADCDACAKEDPTATDKYYSYGELLPHSYTEQIHDAEHLKEAKTCQHPDIYWYDCADCSANAKDSPDADSLTYEFGGLGEHTVVDGICTVCGPHIPTFREVVDEFIEYLFE